MFPYKHTCNAEGIPEDVEVLREVFGVRGVGDTGCVGDTEETLMARPLYNQDNKFFVARSVAEGVGGGRR